MKALILPIIFSSFCKGCEYKENCNAEDGFIEMYNCGGPFPPSCNITYGNGTSVGILNLHSIESNDCQRYCKEDDLCKFYKFLESENEDLKEHYCYLMSENQCNGMRYVNNIFTRQINICIYI